VNSGFWIGKKRFCSWLDADEAYGCALDWNGFILDMDRTKKLKLKNKR